jgi:hypothetical protein
MTLFRYNQMLEVRESSLACSRSVITMIQEMINTEQSASSHQVLMEQMPRVR